MQKLIILASILLRASGKQLDTSKQVGTKASLVDELRMSRGAVFLLTSNEKRDFPGKEETCEVQSNGLNGTAPGLLDTGSCILRLQTNLLSRCVNDNKTANTFRKSIISCTKAIETLHDNESEMFSLVQSPVLGQYRTRLHKEPPVWKPQEPTPTQRGWLLFSGCTSTYWHNLTQPHPSSTRDHRGESLFCPYMNETTKKQQSRASRVGQKGVQTLVGCQVLRELFTK